MHPELENTLISDHEEEPYAVVLGEPLVDLPKDLYIPPNALKIFLEAFSGPLDLLLYLIKRENINILDIPIAQVTAQYMEYVNLMESLQLELAAEYLVMAAMLAEIKSRLLLPRPKTEDEESDPRAELVRRLREYERFKKAAEDLDALPRMEREIFPLAAEVPEVKIVRQLPKIEMQELLAAFASVLERASKYSHHQVRREGLSVRERMTEILTALQTSKFVGFEKMFDVKEGRYGVVVTFMAILELLRQMVIDMVQVEPFGTIHLKVIEVQVNE